MKLALKTLGQKEQLKREPWLNCLLVRTHIYDSFYEMAVSIRNSLVVNFGCGFEKRFTNFGLSWSDGCQSPYYDRHFKSVVESA